MHLYSRMILAIFMALTWTFSPVTNCQTMEARGLNRNKGVLIAKKTKKSKKVDDPVVTVVTNKGNFQIQVFEEEVPVTASNFLSLVKEGFYNGLIFHRYDPNFVIQGGDPTGTGAGGSGKTIPLEISGNLKHSETGMVGLARKSDPNSGSSQFYIILSPRSELDNDYAVFGKVIEGIDIVYQLRKGDKMQEVYIEGSEPKSKTR